MASQGKAVQNYNNQIFKLIEQFRENRDEVNKQILKDKKQILKDEEDEAKIQKVLAIITKRRSKLNQSLQIKKQARSEYDQTIQKTEAAYMKILESSKTLLHVLKRESGNRTEPTTAIWRNTEPCTMQGIRYNYDDKTNHIPIADEITTHPLMVVEYEGSKSKVGNKWIQPGSLFFERHKKRDNYTYIGKVVCVNLLRKHSVLCPALYELTIKRMSIGNVQQGETLKKNSQFKGPGCLKRSALLACGYELDEDKGGGNACAGLNAIKIKNY
jgi:Sjoegren syndrome nuclear autoantigen 1